MHGKKTAAALALASLLGCAIAAQAPAQASAPASAPFPEAPIVSIENGFSSGYNLGTKNVGTAFEIAIGFGVAERIQALVTFIRGDGADFDDYRLLGLSYAVTPKLGVTTLVGADTGIVTPGPAVGLGLYANLLTRGAPGSLQTALRLKIDYLAPTGDLASGILRFDLVAVIGM